MLRQKCSYRKVIEARKKPKKKKKKKKKKKELKFAVYQKTSKS